MNQQQMSILVVLYNKKIQDSVTLDSILQVTCKENLSLTIINNGPEKLSGIDDFINNHKDFKNINFYEFLENRSLSKIYNNFLYDNQNAAFCIIFDDDSSFDSSLLLNVLKSNADIILPLIKNQKDSQIYYPISNNTIVTSETALDINGLISITSGLAISRKLINLMQNVYGPVFDENFALYGIDTSFFARLHRAREIHDKLSIISQDVVLHSLSRTGSQPISNIRLRERLCDAALIARHYPDVKRLTYLLKKIVQNIYRGNFTNLYLLIKCYVTGKHPRS